MINKEFIKYLSFSNNHFSKPFLKSTKGKGLAGMFLLFRTDLGHAGNRSPKDINKSMAMNLRMQYPSEDISDDLLIEEYIPSKRLSEVLQVLEETGLFSHIRNKKDIKKIIGCRRVKLEGRPALYIIPNKIIESNQVLVKTRDKKCDYEALNGYEIIT